MDQCALKLGSADRTRGHSRSGIQVWFAEPWSNLIGQPFYNTRPILRRVASVAGALAAATLVPLGGVPSLGPPRPGNPVEGNGRHTRLKGLIFLFSITKFLCIAKSKMN